LFGFPLRHNSLSSFGTPPRISHPPSVFATNNQDLFYHWRDYKNPKRQLAILLVEIVISFVLGLLPGLDNFSHIGGFATGVLLGIAIMRPPPRIRARLNPPNSRNDFDLDAPYSSLTGRGNSQGRRNGFVGYFKGRRGWWWIWGLVRIGCLALVCVFMALLAVNFWQHGGGHCSWCRYLRYVMTSPYLLPCFIFVEFMIGLKDNANLFSCLPVNGWCDLGNIVTNNSTSNRMLF
jgi:Rhomboid family